MREARYWDKWAGPLCARHAIMDTRARPIPVSPELALKLAKSDPKWEFCLYDPDRQ